MGKMTQAKETTGPSIPTARKCLTMEISGASGSDGTTRQRRKSTRDQTITRGRPSISPKHLRIMNKFLMNQLSQKQKAISTVLAIQHPGHRLCTPSRLHRHRLPLLIYPPAPTTTPRSISIRHIQSKLTLICPNPSFTVKNTWPRTVHTRRQRLHPLRTRCKSRQSRVSLAKLLPRRIHRVPSPSTGQTGTARRYRTVT